MPHEQGSDVAVDDVMRIEEPAKASPEPPEPAALPDAAALLNEPPTPRPDSLVKVRRWVLAVVSVAALTAAVVALTYTPVFNASHIEITGSNRLSTARVARLAGVDAGTNVVRFDEGLAERRLEHSSWVASAEVTASLPSSISISITERRPVAVAQTDGGLSLVAGDGVILESAAGAVNLPRIRPVYGTPIPDTAERRLGAAIVRSLPSALAATAEVVVVNGDGTVDLMLRGGVPVSYGTPTELAAKAQSLRAILRWASREGVRLTSISVESPGAPSADTVGRGTLDSQAIEVGPDSR